MIFHRVLKALLSVSLDAPWCATHVLSHPDPSRSKCKYGERLVPISRAHLYFVTERVAECFPLAMVNLRSLLSLLLAFFVHREFNLIH